jgi:signal transduction histidine kinase
VWRGRHLSVRARLASVAAAVVLVGYLVVALALMGAVTDRVGDDLAARLRMAPTVSESVTYGPTGFDPAADGGSRGGSSVAVVAVEVRPALSYWARVLTFATAPVLAAVTGLLTWFAAGRALRPVAAIENEFRGLAAGDPTRRVPVPGGNDEVSRLARTMNETLDALEASGARQRRFVADAAHELRGPIGAVRTNLEVAAAYPDRVNPQAGIRSALDEVERLQSVAEDLLTLARLESGEARPGLPVPVDEIIADLIPPADVSYRVTVEAPSPQVLGSERQLRRLLQNLVDNAARHANSGVQVTVGLVDGTVRVDVDDDGPGIPANLREQVFVPFFRADDARARADGGTGLGLAIAAETARAHCGTVEALESPTGGARLRVTLPTHW